MLRTNQSLVMEFIFVGLTDNPKLNSLLFTLFLHVYIITLVGNVGLIIVSRVNKTLHKPMYLFLSNLSFVDLVYSSAVTPKMLRDLLAETKVISFIGCAFQMYVFVSFASIECLILGVMAYDRYVAICSPLLYGVLMSYTLCLRMLMASYSGGFMNAVVHTTSVFHQNLFRSNVINHFFCDFPPLYKLSCSDISANLDVMFALGGAITLICLILIFISYTNIVLTIMKIQSSQGRYKAFNTCASHMIAVSVFYGTVIFVYFRPSTSNTLQQDRVASVFYSIIIPMLNPLIYSLRNTEVIETLKRLKVA